GCTVDHQRLDHVHAEAEPPAQVAQHVGVAASASPEPMVEADDDLLRGKPVDQHVFHERLGLDGGQFAREVQHDGAVHAAGADERQALVERRDGQWCAVRLQHLQRVRLEGARQRGRARGARVSDRGTKNRPVAEMDAIEDAEGDRARSPLRRDGRKAPDDPHAPFSPAERCAPSLPPRPRRAGRPPCRTRARAFPPPAAPRTRTYVPLPHTMRSVALVSSSLSTSIALTTTSRGVRSTSTPSRASSYRRRPSWWTAEYIGGTCAMRPTKPRQAASSHSRV